MDLSFPFDIVTSPLQGSLDFLFRCLLSFLLESTGQDDKPITVHETQEAKSVSADVCSHFPEICSHQLLVEFPRWLWQLANQLKNPDDLLCLLSIQTIKELPNGTSPRG